MTRIARSAARTLRTIGAASVAIAAFAAAGCTAPYVIDEWRTGYVPRYHLNDRAYEVTVRVSDGCGEPLDGHLVRLRGIRHLNGFRDAPETEFYLFGLSGESGRHGAITFRFPAPRDPKALDLYAVVYEKDPDVYSTFFFPGKYWYLKGAHSEIQMGDDGTAFVSVNPDA